MERFVAASQRQKSQPNGAARWLVLIVIVFAGNAITARAQNTSGPQRGGTLIYSEPQPVNSFMPVLSPASILDDEVEVLLYRPLLWIGQKVTVEMDRSIADAISVSGNNTVFTVGMRHDYVWSDGMPVTADDVAYCFNLIKTYSTKYAYYGIGGLPTLVKSFKMISPYSFSITLSKSVNPDWFNFYPIGAGLFDTTGGANFGSFSDPKMDALINEAQVTPGLKGVFSYQDYASQVVPCLYLDQPTTIIKYQPNVHGVTDFFNPVFAYSPEYLWLSH